MIDYVLPINVVLATYFIVMNFLDYVSTIVFFRLGHIELNQFVNEFLQRGLLVELFLLKVVLVSLVIIAFIIGEKFIESKFTYNKFVRVAPISFSLMFLVVNVFMTFIVINNVLVIGGMGGFVCQ